MALRKSFFNMAKELRESVERYAPLWVLYSMTRNVSDAQSLEERIFGDAGGKSYAVKEILL